MKITAQEFTQNASKPAGSLLGAVGGGVAAAVFCRRKPNLMLKLTARTLGTGGHPVVWAANSVFMQGVTTIASGALGAAAGWKCGSRFAANKVVSDLTPEN